MSNSNNPVSAPKSIVEKIADKASELISNKDSQGKSTLALLSEEQKNQLDEIERNAISKPGQIDDAEAAIGMLRMGHHYGWKVLYIVHSKKTIRKYEDILGVKIRDIFPEEGPCAPRSVGLSLAKKFPNFWKVVSGDIKITNRKEVT